MPIQPKGIILHSMSEYLMWKGQKLYAKDFLKALGLSVHGFIKPDGTYDKMVVSPNKDAIWLAVWPLDHNSFSFFSLSGVQLIYLS